MLFIFIPWEIPKQIYPRSNVICLLFIYCFFLIVGGNSWLYRPEIHHIPRYIWTVAGATPPSLSIFVMLFFAILYWTILDIDFWTKIFFLLRLSYLCIINRGGMLIFFLVRKLSCEGGEKISKKLLALLARTFEK